MLTSLLIPLAGGFFDWLSSLTSSGENAIRGAAVLFALVFFFIACAKGGFKLSVIIMSGIAAAIFLAIVFNVTAMQSKVSTEINKTGGVIAPAFLPRS